VEASEAYPRRPGRLVAWLAFVGVVAAAGYANTIFGEDPPDDLLYEYTTAAGLIVQSGIFLGILLLIVLHLPKGQLFGLRQPVSWRQALGLAAGSLVAVWILNLALSPVLDAGEEQGLLPEEWQSDRVAAFVAVGLTITFLGPVVEELMFRGVGFALLAPYGKWVAILGTGILFGALHGLLIAFPILAAFGVILGWLRWRTGSVYPCMLLHIVFNGIGIISVPFVADS
jgi:membrane protease YdiL (CAAX protease family)